MFLSGSMQCAHCGVTKSPLWRNIPSEGTCCNACGLYFKNNNRRRPLELLGKPKAPTASTEGTPRTPKERDRSRKDANTKRADRHLDANTLLITPNFQNRTTRTAIGLQRSKPWVKPALPSRRESRKATHVFRAIESPPAHIQRVSDSLSDSALYLGKLYTTGQLVALSLYLHPSENTETDKQVVCANQAGQTPQTERASKRRRITRVPNHLVDFVSTQNSKRTEHLAVGEKWPLPKKATAYKASHSVDTPHEMYAMLSHFSTTATGEKRVFFRWLLPKPHTLTASRLATTRLTAKDFSLGPWHTHYVDMSLIRRSLAFVLPAPDMEASNMTRKGEEARTATEGEVAEDLDAMPIQSKATDSSQRRQSNRQSQKKTPKAEETRMSIDKHEHQINPSFISAEANGAATSAVQSLDNAAIMRQVAEPRHRSRDSFDSITAAALLIDARSP